VDDRERALVELKRKAGLATPEEIRVLDSEWVRRGESGGLVVPPPATSLEQWAANCEAGVYGPNEVSLVAKGFTMAKEPPIDFEIGRDGGERIVRV